MMNDLSHSDCLERQEAVKKMFATCKTPEERYSKLIALGRALPSFDAAHKTPDNEVPGCQSVMYLYSRLEDGRVYFTATAEALISAGLAAILLQVYSGLPPEVILTCPPSYLEALELASSLSPNRAGGLYSIHLKMKQEALRLLIQQKP